MKNNSIFLKPPTAAILFFVLSGCYTQLATTKIVYVESPVKKNSVNVIELDSSRTILDSAYVYDDQQVVVKEYHYWAYEPLFDLEPYDVDYRINIYYPRVRHHYYGYDPYWDYYSWHYDPWWNYNPWYAHHRWYRHPYHHHHHNYWGGGWYGPWYAYNDDRLPKKKRDWDRRGRQEINRPNPVSAGNQVMTYQPVAGTNNESGGTQRLISRTTKSDEDQQAIRRNNNTRQVIERTTKHKRVKTYSASAAQLIKLIATRHTRDDDRQANRTIVRKSKSGSNSKSAGSDGRKTKSKSKSYSKASKTKSSSRSKATKSSSRKRSSGSSKSKRSRR